MEIVAEPCSEKSAGSSGNLTASGLVPEVPEGSQVLVKLT